LRNTPILVKPGQRYERDGQDGKPWVYVECEVVTLDRQGIVEHADGVRVSWVRVLPQLEGARDQWVAARPVDTGEGIVLEPLSGAARDVAERVADELDRPSGQHELGGDEDAFG
jgi:hypothetical protein